MSSIRLFVLVEPFRPGDFTICHTIGQATRQITAYTALGLTSRLFETSGTIGDLRPMRRQLRAAHLAKLNRQVSV